MMLQQQCILCEATPPYTRICILYHTPPLNFLGERGYLTNGKRYEDKKVAFMWRLQSRKKVCKKSAVVKIFPQRRRGGYAEFFQQGQTFEFES